MCVYVHATLHEGNCVSHLLHHCIDRLHNHDSERCFCWLQDNGSARRWCSMPEETADEENRCFVSVHKLCSGEIRAGHGSICIHTLVGSVIRCEEGQWVSKGACSVSPGSFVLLPSPFSLPHCDTDIVVRRPAC